MRFEHPHTKVEMTIVAPLPEHMAHTFETFDWTADMAEEDPFASLR